MNSRLSKIKRNLKIPIQDTQALFLWGARKTGKTTLLKQQFPKAKFYDLLQSDLKTKLLLSPHLLRQEILAEKYKIVIIDEVQKVPDLLDEVHWCLENTSTKFILCGSSARKLKRGAANLLGGRAWRFELFPLTTQELEDPNLLRIFNHGLLPSHYLNQKPERNLKSYLLDYLNEEIQAEALLRNVVAFSRFLEVASFDHGNLLNYANCARDAGVAAKTIREYYQILEDTLLGHRLAPWKKSKNRRLIETEKFYFFDLGLVRALKNMNIVQEKTEEFGRCFEHFLIEEIRAYLSYTEKNMPLSYWRTSNGLEVDLIVGDMQLALEFKATSHIHSKDFSGLRALSEENKVKRKIIVCLQETSRQSEEKIEIIYWENFCKLLWAGELGI